MLFANTVRLLILVFGLMSLSAVAQDGLAINQLLDGLHDDAANARFESYFERYTDDGIFLGTDRAERWTIPQFKAYAKPIFDAGRGWSYSVIERNLEGRGDTRWFDEVLFNNKLGPCRGSGVVVKTPSGWRIAHYSLTLLIPNDIAEDVGGQSKALWPGQ